jgi:hypothetical protein
LLHEEKIAQSWTQEKEIPFQESTQFLALQASQKKNGAFVTSLAQKPAP